MGRLSGFLAGFTGSLASQMKEDRDAKRKAEENEQQFKTQLNYAKAAAAMGQNLKTNTAVPTPQADGPVVQDENGNWVQRTTIESGALVDDNLNVVRKPSLIAGPTQAAMNPNALTPKDQATIDQRDRAAKLRADTQLQAARIRDSRSGGGSAIPRDEDGMTKREREQLQISRDREARLSKPKSGGGMTEKGWRDGMDSTLSSIEGAGEGKLKTIIRQYGGDNVMTGDMDKDMLREAAFSVAETYWNERKPSNKKASEPSANRAGASEDNPVTTATKADVEKLPKGTWFITPAGKVYQK